MNTINRLKSECPRLLDQKSDLDLLLEVSGNYYKYLLVPTSTIYPIKRIESAKLKKVHKDTDIARELLYALMSLFSRSYNRTNKADKNSAESKGYIRLDSQVMKETFRINRSVPYAKGLQLLIEEGIIEMGKNYSTYDNKAREYRIAPRYFNKKVSKKLPTQDFTKRYLKNMRVNAVKHVLDNPIAMEAIRIRESITFPTAEEMKAHLIKEAKSGTTNKRGMKLVYLNKRNPNNFKNSVFIEDYLIDYQNTRDNFLMPIISGEKSGGRVYTAYNTMAQVMRKHLLIDGEEIVEVDYSTLHPNLVNTIYGDSMVSITHDMVAEELGISRKEAKIEHLSFFNKNLYTMKESPLFKYYKDNFGKMLARVINNKHTKGHKDISKQLFKLEVEIMTEVTKELIKRGLKALYVFDAMYVPKTKAQQIKEIMNNTAEMFNVNTTV